MVILYENQINFYIYIIIIIIYKKSLILLKKMLLLRLLINQIVPMRNTSNEINNEIQH